MADTKKPSGQENIADVVTGQISSTEDGIKETLEKLFFDLEEDPKNGLSAIILGTNNIVSELQVVSSMLIAIAGYLYSEKGINSSTGFAQLTSKIKANDPILGDTPIDDYLKPDPKDVKTKGKASLEVLISGVDKKGLEGLTKLLEEINKHYADNSQKALETISQSFSHLTNITKTLDKMKLNVKKEHIESIKNIDKIIKEIGKLQVNKFGKKFSNDLNNFKDVVKALTEISLFSGKGKDKLNTKEISKLASSGAINNLNSVISEIGAIDFSKFTKKTINQIEGFENVLVAIGNATEIITELCNLEEDFEDFKEFTDCLKTNVLDELQKLDFGFFTKKEVEKITGFNDFIEEVGYSAGTLLRSILAINIVLSFKDDILEYNKFLAEFISGNNGKGGLVMVMNRITNATKSGLDLKLINTFFEELGSVMKTVSKLGLWCVIAGVFAGSITASVKTLNNIIDATSELNIKEIKVQAKGLHEFAEFVTDIRNIFVGVTICGLLAIPAFIGAFIVKFTASSIIDAVSGAIDNMQKLTEDEKKTASLQGFGKLLLVMGALILVAALLGGFLMSRFMDIMGFALILGAFILATVGILGLISMFADAETLKSISQLHHIIVACALVMIVGALFMLTGLWKESLLFGAVLSGFILMVMIPFVLMSLFFDKAIKGAKDICMLIITCTIIMILGAVFMLSGLWKESLLFGAILAVFILMVIAPFILFALVGGKKALKSVKEIQNMIITCTIILIIGAFLMMIPGFAESAILFALIIAGFVFIIAGTFALFGKKLQKGMPAVYALAVLVAVCSFVLMLGANYVRQYGWEDIAIFGVIVVGFIVVIGGASVILGQFQKDLMKGLLAMACIVGISMLFGITLKMVAEACQLADPLEMLAMVGIIAAIILVIGGLSVALGALSAIPPVSLFFWAGIAAMAAVSGIAVMFSVAIKNIAIAAKLLGEATKEGFSIENAMKIVGSMIVLGQAVGAAGMTMPIGIIMAASISFTFMAMMISKIGKAVAEISNLTVATKWNNDGEGIEFRQLDKGDFQKAADNTKTIISTLGDAIIEIYNKKPEMFKAPVITSRSWFKTTQKQGKTPFELVCTACSSMGNMISLIGKGVAEMADLKIATEWNSDGSPKAYRHLKESDFKLAADNISKIITTVGTAIIGIYSMKKEMFEVPMITQKTWWGGTRKVSNPNGKTVFEKVTTACSSMGNMITMIAQGVRDFATMSYATKWNSDGVPIEYKKLSDSDIQSAINNIYRTILSTFHAIMTVYNWDPKFFDTKIEFENGFVKASNPVYSVIRAGNMMGKMISSLSQGVSDIANLKVATKWNKDGVAIDYRYLTDKDFENYGINVKRILVATVEAVEAAYIGNEHLFDSIEFSAGWISFKSDSPIKKVVTSCQGLGALISEMAKAVQDVVALEFKDAKGNVVKLKYEDFVYGGTVYMTVRNLLTCIPRATFFAEQDCPDGTTDALNYFIERSDKIKKIVETYFELGKLAIEQCEKVDAKSLYHNVRDNTYHRMYLTLLAVPHAAYEAYNYLKDGTATAIKYFASDINDNVTKIVKSYPAFVTTLNKTLKESTVDKTIKTWTKMLVGITTPFDNKIIDKERLKKIEKFSKLRFGNTKDLVKTINSLNEAKTDKFIELANSLSELSFSLADMQSIVQALDGRINETLTELAEKLEFAANAIKESDKAQDKRQKLIDKNTAKIRKVMEQPLVVNLKKDVNISSGSTTPTGDGDGVPKNSNAGANGGNGGNGGNGIDNATLRSLSATLTEIRNKVVNSKKL